MTVQKRHTHNGVENVCEAKIKCRYEGSASHHYYDTSIGTKVLDPESEQQQRLNQVPVADLHKIFEGNETEGYKEAHAQYEKTSADFNARQEKLIKSYPEPKQNFVQQLLDTPGENSLIGAFEIVDIPSREHIKTTASPEERIAFAASYLHKVKAEEKLRAHTSAYLAAK